MKKGTPADSLRRAYRQGARAAATADTQRRIVAAMLERLHAAWYEEITLEDVAAAAGVTVQTVIRRFGNKEGLLEAAAVAFGEAIRERRTTPAGDLRGAVEALVRDYEITGDVTMRLLAQERLAPVQAVLELGRGQHRDWVKRMFAPWIDPLPRAERARRMAALVVMTDVYTWKLLRRDQNLGLDATSAVIAEMIVALIGGAASARR